MKDDALIIHEAFHKACDELQLTKEIRASIAGLEKHSNESEVVNKPEVIAESQCLLLIELYKRLNILSSGNADLIQHLLNTHNTHLDATPTDLLQSPKGLKQLVNYYTSISP